MRARSAVLAPPTAHPGSLRRVLLTLVLGLVAFSVVGMHQLSLSHSFATPGADPHRPVSQAAGSDLHQAMEMRPGQPGGHLGDLAAAATDSNAGSEDGCPGCGDHSMAFTACLLALTLLVLFWSLAPPRLRDRPPARRSWRTGRTVAVVRRVPALSLVELSILRR